MSDWLGDMLAKNIVSGTWAKDSLVQLAPDLLIAHDISFPMAAAVFDAMGFQAVVNPKRIYIVNDHLQPAKDSLSANLVLNGQKFASAKGIPHFATVGIGGILTIALDELAVLKLGMLIAGTDTHMPTYGAFGIIALNIGPTDLAHAMGTGTFWFFPPRTVCLTLAGKLEIFVGGRDVGLHVLGKIGLDGGLGKYFVLEGPVVESFRISSRRQLCNLMVEAGAVGVYMHPDKIVATHLGITEDKLPEERRLVCVDALSFDLTGLQPQVALPGRMDDVHPVDEIEPVDVDTVFVGSCAGGSIEDLMAVDEVLQSNRIHDRVKVIVAPQSAGTLREAERLGIIGRLTERGVYITGPGCGPCMGAHLGVLGKDEVCVSTSPRNYPGRMGSRLAKVYLANAWVAAAASVAGHIIHPKEVLQKG
jgi:homoaconitase/3-isopropylmalate dehydratase large subunit